MMKHHHRMTKEAAEIPSFLPLTLVLLTASLMLACHKERNIPVDATSRTARQTISIEKPVAVVSSVLTFATMETFNRAAEQFSNASFQQLKQMPHYGAFVSYARIIDSLTDLVAAAPTEALMLQLIHENSRFLKIEDSTVVAQVPYHYYHWAANDVSKFQIDSTLYKLFTSGVIAWRGASMYEINAFEPDENFR